VAGTTGFTTGAGGGVVGTAEADAGTTGLTTGDAGGGMVGREDPTGGATGLIAGITGGGTVVFGEDGGAIDSSEIDWVRRGGATVPGFTSICAVPVDERTGGGTGGC
jgi:hypothetical protein